MTQTTPPRKPDDFLVWSVLCTVLCCLPLGIVSIIKSCQVDTYWNQGAYDEALKAAADARKWAWWGFGLAVAIPILYVIIIAFGLGIAAIAS